MPPRNAKPPSKRGVILLKHCADLKGCFMFCTGLDKVPDVFIEILCPKDSVPLPALAGGTENS